jgi:hypothetical protein
LKGVISFSSFEDWGVQTIVSTHEVQSLHIRGKLRDLINNS